MKKRKMVLWIALIVMAIIPVFAQQYDSEKDFQIDWDENVEGGIAITKYIGTKREVRIPPSIQNNPVTKIGDRAFENKPSPFNKKSNITKVTIPNSVTSIGREAFYNCESLASINIPNSVTSIGSRAFRDCESLASINIPNGVTSIEYETFYGCESLASINIPNSVTSIGSRAFQSCRSLTRINIPNSVTSIGDWAFGGCTSLTSVTIPNSVTSIVDVAFDECKSLTSVTFQGAISQNNFVWNAFPGDLRDKYLASDGGFGTYKRFANGEVWKKQSETEINVPQQQTAKLPTDFTGVWKRDNFNNTLTFTETTVKSSSRDNTWSFISVSGDTFTLESNTAAKTRMALTIRMVNGNIVISGDSGSGENNWNGTWRKQ